MIPKPTSTRDELIVLIRGMSNPESVAGMQCFAIRGGIPDD